MLKLLICACVFIAFAKADYDFQDSDFNKLLIDDLTANVDDENLELHRFKRSVVKRSECHENESEQDVHCCRGDKGDPDDLAEIQAVKTNCVAEVRVESGNEEPFDALSCASITKLKQQMVCVLECKAKKFNLLTEHGDFKRDPLVKHLRRVYGAHKWKGSVLDGYADKCLYELRISTDLQQGDNTTSGGCNPNPLAFYHCIWRHFVGGCPAELQVNSHKCRRTRNRVAKGDTSQADKSLKQLLRS